MSVVNQDLRGSLVVAQAAELLKTDPAAAEPIARELLALHPNAPEARYIYGSALRLLGRLEEAQTLLGPLAVEQTGCWATQAESAQVLFALGRSRAASVTAERAVALNPDWALGWRLLGDIRRFARDLDGAHAADDQRLLATAEPALRGAASAMVQGDLEAAERALAATHQRHPRSGPAAHLLAEVLLRRGRLADAESMLAACVRQAPELDDARLAYADVIARTGRAALALQQIELLLERDPESLRGRMLKSALLAELQDYAGAAEVTASLLADIPDQPQAWLDYGSGLQILGRPEDAAAAFRKCLELDQAFTQAYWALARLKAARFTPADEADMERLAARADLPGETRTYLHFSLGKAREEAGSWAESFTHYAEANRIARAARPPEPDVAPALIKRAKAVFTAEFFAERQGWGQAAPDPIFIVGLPRSGSTLVEQILASHPAVEGAGERDDIELIAKFVGGLDIARSPTVLAGAPREPLLQFGQDYLKWTRPFRRLGRPRFVDKAPANFLHVGLIQLILPEAKIIDVRRHPMGCCLSAFKEHFAEGRDFTYDLESLGRYYVQYLELMDHYDAVLPGRVHRVIYEDLVGDVEAKVRDLLAYCELPFDPACLRFFENPRPVTTASAGQVRRPIYSQATDHWRHFEPWLGPLKAALGDAPETYRRTYRRR